MRGLKRLLTMAVRSGLLEALTDPAPRRAPSPHDPVPPRATTPDPLTTVLRVHSPSNAEEEPVSLT